MAHANDERRKRQRTGSCSASLLSSQHCVTSHAVSHRICSGITRSHSIMRPRCLDMWRCTTHKRRIGRVSIQRQLIVRLPTPLPNMRIIRCDAGSALVTRTPCILFMTLINSPASLTLPCNLSSSHNAELLYCKQPLKTGIIHRCPCDNPSPSRT